VALSVFGLVVGLLMTVVTARSVADPLTTLREAVSKIGDGQLDVSVAVDDGGEVGLLQHGMNQMVAGLRERRRLADLFGRHVGSEVARLARTMNGMLDRLERASARQRAFVSDASHELRSPVSTIRAELEVASADAEHADWPAVAQRTLGETDRLGRLVDDLLALARLDEAQGSPKRVPVDIDDLVLEESTRTHRVPVRTVGVSAGRVAGDARQLTQVVRNLVDNAQRHAATQVAISLRREDDELVLVVDDDGPGIPEAEREHVFDRFTRLDEARGRADGGAGLGLAVVRRVVEHHGGTVSVVESDLGGARFIVRLPAL
jgi:signal transduction histidine kinase